MEKVQTYEKYRELLKGYKREHKGIVTNMYMMPDKLKKIIGQGRLFYVCGEEALIFLSDEKTHFRLYFYQNEACKVNLPKLEKRILIELIFNENCETSSLNQIKELYKDAGFQFKKRCYLYSASVEARERTLELEYVDVTTRLEKCHLVSEYAKEDDLFQIKLLWDKYLDKYDFEYLTKEELVHLVEQKEILIIKDHNRVIATECLMTTGNNKRLECHLAVSEKYRGYGLGKMILFQGFRKSLEEDVEFYSAWIDEENLTSIKLHLKAAVKTERVLEHYIL